ncbi:hypothetical protein INT47_001083 [Mucor saturninus]|uniref:Calcineurin-like phosphoesterase domain-containing protein n=1 Tax=Mucor saturninus TaxID=64648 RepID=A0A8H7RMR0_9FUNG|nr:hypothetical protein INT47_001083 [Mucor saturninus]
MAQFSRDDVSSFEYVEAIPRNDRTPKQQRMWRYIAMAVAAVVVIVVVVVVAVVVTNHKKNNQTSSTGNNQLVISPYSNMQAIVTNNDTSLQQKERIFVIGDVHGCVKEFNDIVAKLNYDPTKDQIILAGDLTSKGPDSVGVVRRAKELGVLCVRGNHDDKVVRLKTFEIEKGRNAMYPVDATMPEGGVPDPIKFKNYHTGVSFNFTQSDYDYLASCPVMLHMPFLNNTIVVHGGLDPNIHSLENQIPFMVMNMRDIDKNNVTSIDSGVGEQWATVWNANQKLLNMDNTMIYYGHDSSRGLNIKQTTFGLDTGCVYGGSLTAINVKTHELTQVSCQTYVKKGSSNDD